MVTGHERKARRLEPVRIRIQVTANVGIVMTDMIPRHYDDLYRAADIAMYMAKSQGGNKALFYSPDMQDKRESTEGPVRIEVPGRNDSPGSALG